MPNAATASHDPMRPLGQNKVGPVVPMRGHAHQIGQIKPARESATH
jgi:hypothetical protein